MNPGKSFQEKNHSTEINHHQPDTKNDFNKKAASRKVYIHRNSVLTDMMHLNHIQCLYNFITATTLAIFLNMTVLYLTEPSKFWDDLSCLKWLSSKFLYFLIFWSLFHVFAFAFYEGFKLWIAVRNKIHSKFADTLFLLLYIASLILTFTATAFCILKINLRPMLAIAAGCEQVRIYMKIHSFVKENISRGMQYKPLKDGNQLYTLYPTRQHYLYYLFAPVLIYRDSYPRSENRQWKTIIYYFCEFSFCVFLFYCAFMRLNIDMYKNIGIKPFEKKDIALLISTTTTVGISFMILIFHSLFHSLQNMFAELLMFGDREFYQDWWNSITFGEYYRKWNILVHDWLYAYVYKELRKVRCGTSVSMTLTFLTSAVFHEYVMTLSLGYFYPGIFLAHSSTILHIFLTRSRKSCYWNIFMWCNFLFGNAVVTAVYTIEWYARINCPKEGNHFISTPRFLDPSCHIFSFS